jgi:hypothetical protein
VRSEQALMFTLNLQKRLRARFEKITRDHRLGDSSGSSFGISLDACAKLELS